MYTLPRAFCAAGQWPDSGRGRGGAQAFQDSLKSQPWLILAAIPTVYIVLGVLYENAVHPLTNLGVLPSAGFCASLAALLGAIALALRDGAGSELRRPLGIAIVGGLVLSQVLTLYTTPVIYLAFERLRQRRQRLPVVESA